MVNAMNNAWALISGIIFICLLIAFPAYLTILYSGRSNDIFINKSRKIKNKRILTTIVSKIKGQINVILNIYLYCTATVKKGESSKLGNERLDVLNGNILPNY